MQVAFIYMREDPIAYGLLERIVVVTSPRSPLFDFTDNYCNQLIADTCKHFELDVKFSGHSARAGFASERVAQGESEVDVQRRGR